MSLPNIDLALAVAAEWDAQIDRRKGIQPASMPMMTLASTAIDQIQPDPQPTISTCMGYLPTDTALFWAPEEERILLKKQRQHFEPVLKWLRRTAGVELSTAQLLQGKLSHPTESIEKVHKIVSSLVGRPIR